MKIYFVRHGESELNAQRIHQPADAKLSATGLMQAKLVAKRFTNIAVDMIVSSEFDRAKQTAEVVSEHLRKPFTLSNLFVERRRPSEIVNKPGKDSQVTAIKDLIKQNYTDISWRHSDEENFSDLNARAKAALRYLEGLNKESVLVVTHGAILRAIIGVMLFKDELTPKEEMRLQKFMELGNAALSICEFKEDKWRLISWNDQLHLKDYSLA